MTEVGTLSEGPVSLPAPNAYWGRKFGTINVRTGEREFRIKRWAARTGNSNSRPKHYTALLVAQAISKGWLNGKRLHTTKIGGQSA